MSRVYWESMLFIYLLEANPEFGPKVQLFHDFMRQRGDILCTSVFTIGEVLTGPRKKNDLAGVAAIKSFFESSEVVILPFDSKAADQYSVIRSATRVSQADGIHLATASAAFVDLFVTNDNELRQLTISGITFFADLDGRVM